MAWGPSEVALVITSSATAVTAVAGVVIPVWKRWWEKRDDRREATYERLAQSIRFSVENVERVVDNDQANRMRLAYIEAGRSPGSFDEEGEKIKKELLSAIRVAELTAREIGLDIAPFRRAVALVRSSTVKFRVDPTTGSLEQDDAQAHEAIDAQRKHLDELVDEGSKLLSAARHRLGVHYA